MQQNKVLIAIIFSLSLLLANCSTQNKYPDGSCNCSELTGPEGGWRLNDKPYTGKCFTYYQNGNKKSEAEFVEGKINGQLITYYPNGNIEENVEWKNGNASGKVKYYFESGTLSHEGNIVEESKEGVWKVYYENGQLKSLEKWKNNVQVDSSLAYFKNGNLHMKGYWNNGNIDGKWTFFDSISGKIDGYLIYKNGKTIKKIKVDE